jgi:solute carrier family 50 (sugar transporter)
VKLIRENASLGSVNTFPFPMMVVNSMSWMIYGTAIKDIYVFFPNLFGFSFGIYYTLSTYPYQSQKSKDSATFILIGFGSLMFIIGAVANIYVSDIQAGHKMIGIVCVLILIVFYSSPLSTMAHIVKTKTAASVHLGLAIATLINGILWAVYGLVVNDWFVSGPNILGAIFAIIQLLLVRIYGRGIRSASREVFIPEDDSFTN